MSQLPTDEKIIADIEKDHGNIMSITLIDGVQFGKTDSSYAYDNEMIKTFTAETKEGEKKSFRANVIYTRSGPNDEWLYNRYFIFENSINNKSIQKLTTDEITNIILASFKTNISDWGIIQNAYHFYGVAVIEDHIQMISANHFKFSCIFFVLLDANSTSTHADIAKTEVRFQPEFTRREQSEEWMLISTGYVAPDTVVEVLYPNVPYEIRSQLKKVPTHFREIIGPQETVGVQLAQLQ